MREGGVGVACIGVLDMVLMGRQTMRGGRWTYCSASLIRLLMECGGGGENK